MADERRIIPERLADKAAPIVWESPDDLIMNNTAIEVCNQSRVRTLVASFNPLEWKAPDGVYTQTYKSSGSGVQQVESESVLFIKDGMNRTYACRKLHQEGTRYEPPQNIPEPLPAADFSLIPVRDVTASQFEAYNLKPAAYDKKGNPILTVAQYQVLVVEPTLQHAAIAGKRAAALFRAGWADMIGEKAAQEFTITAALNLLAGTRTMSESLMQARLEVYLRNLGTYIEGETPEMRERIVRALLHTRTMITNLKLDPQKVARAAFEQIVTGSPIIGGKDKIQNELFDLLNNREVRVRLEEQFDPIVAEVKRQEIGRAILTTIQNIKDPAAKSEALQDIYHTLINNHFTYDQSLEIATHASPSARYTEVVRDANATTIALHYREHISQGRDPTGDEAALLNSLGRIRYISTVDLDKISEAVQRGSSALEAARRYISQLRADKDMLLSQGVNEETIVQIEQTLSNVSAQVNNASAPKALNSRSRELSVEIVEAGKRIQFQIDTKLVNDSITVAHANSLVTNFRRNDLSAHLIQLIEVEGLAANQIDSYLAQLGTLDLDLQHSVVSGTLSLTAASERQLNRQQTPEQAENRLSALDQMIDASNETLVASTTVFNSELDRTHLSPYQLTEEAKKGLERMINKAARLLTGESVDAVTTIYDKLKVEQQIRDNERRVQQDMLKTEEEKED